MRKLAIFALCVICLCGCTPIERGTQEPIAPAVSAVAEKIDTDTINISVGNDFNFQPHSVKSENSKSALGFIYEPLYTFDASMTPIPVLAESLEKKDNTITVNLKKNVMFHDGTALSASDVVYSVNLILNKVSTYTQSNIVSAKEKSATSVTITLRHATVCPEEVLTFPIVKNKAPQSMDRPNGTGAFAFYAEKGFDTYVFKTFDLYHGEKPKFQTLNLITCTSDEQIKQLYDIGETDIITADSSLLSSFTPRTNSAIYTYPTNKMIYIGFNNDRISARMRRAVYLAVKKKDITEKCFAHSAQYTDYPIIPSYISPETSAYDAEEAEKEMYLDGYEQKDGMFMKNGQKATINFMIEGEEYRELFDEIAQSLKIFGIECNLVPTSFYYDKLASSDFDACLGSLKAGVDMTEILGEGNPFRYNNPDFNALSRYDKENVLAAIKIFENDAPIVPICFENSAVSADNKLSSKLAPSFSYPYYGFNTWVLK